MSCSQISVDWVIQHLGRDAIETHHIRQSAVIILCVESGGGNLMVTTAGSYVMFGEEILR